MNKIEWMNSLCIYIHTSGESPSAESTSARNNRNSNRSFCDSFVNSSIKKLDIGVFLRTIQLSIIK